MQAIRSGKAQHIAHTWPGSACEADSHIPFILAQEGAAGERLRATMRKMGGDAPSEMALAPFVRALFGK